MGLLERALQYKQRINDSGKETLIDRIKGPAETIPLKELNVKKIDISEIDQTTEILVDVDESFKKNNDVSAENLKIRTETKNIEEDIIIFNEHDFDKSELKENKEKQNIRILPVEIEQDVISEESILVKPDEIIRSEIEVEQHDGETIDNIDKVIEEVDIEHKDFEMPEFNDYGTLFEIQKEFIKADTIEDVYSTILFSIMGQIGVSSVSIVAPSSEDDKKWIIQETHGIKISDNNLYWEIEKGIFQILNTYKGVLDIEDIKNDINCREDYYKFTAVDARIITPLLKNGILAGAILVGEKINSEEFTPLEKEFLQELSDISSSIIESLAKFEKTSTELFGLRIEKEILSDVEFFQDSLLNISSLDELGDVIKKNFYSLGLESYCLFMQDQVGRDYFPIYFDSKDLLGFSNSGFTIKRNNRLATFLINKKSSIILENFNESSVIIDTFGRNRIIKMELFIAYPFIISGKLSGFITIFKINPAVDIIDIDIRIQKINRFLFPYLHRIYELDPEMCKYNDLTAMFYDRIEPEIKHAQELNIPLSLVLITIKNYKRFYDRFGKIELEKLTQIISEIIKSKIYAGDFSARIDRNKFLIVLPGKEKRYSIMLSNSIKNEIIEKYNMSDFSLLITSLISVFPDDGKDLFSILDILE